MLSTAAFFKALSDETRLRCLVLLQAHTELCVCELTAALDLSQPKISRHLAHLRQIGLILDQRKGKWVYYRLNASLSNWSCNILSEAANSSDLVFTEDHKRLLAMTNRPDIESCG